MDERSPDQMSVIRSLMDGIGVGTLGFVEQRVQTKVQRPSEVPSKVPPMSPSDELGVLEKEALEKGISHDEMDKTRRIGDCPAQVQTRIKRLHEWLAAH